MSDQTDNKPPKRGGDRDRARGGGRGDGRPGGERKGGGGRGPGRGKGGKGGKFGDGPKRAPAVTYETLNVVTRGADFRIEKFVVAEKGSHKAVKTEYRLYREGLDGPRVYPRLFEAQAAATEPLPEPVPPEAAMVEAVEAAPAAPESEALGEASQAPEPAPLEASADSAEAAAPEA